MVLVHTETMGLATTMTKTSDFSQDKFLNALQPLMAKIDSHLLPPVDESTKFNHHDEDLETILGKKDYLTLMVSLKAGNAYRLEESSENSLSESDNSIDDLLDEALDLYISKKQLNAYKQNLLAKLDRIKTMTQKERLELSKSVHIYTFLCLHFLMSRPNYWK